MKKTIVQSIVLLSILLFSSTIATKADTYCDQFCLDNLGPGYSGKPTQDRNGNPIACNGVIIGDCCCEKLILQNLNPTIPRTGEEPSRPPASNKIAPQWSQFVGY